MKMITKRGIFLWIMSLAFVVGLVFMTVSLVQNGDTWVMKRFNHHVYSNGELIGAGTIMTRTAMFLPKPRTATVFIPILPQPESQHSMLSVTQRTLFQQAFSLFIPQGSRDTA
ncbi:MAG: hypothetical protein ACLS27_00420 [Eubacterium sp.]